MEFVSVGIQNISCSPVDGGLLWTEALVTVILHFAFSPFSVLAVIVTVPALIAVTTPLLFTFATF